MKRKDLEALHWARPQPRGTCEPEFQDAPLGSHPTPTPDKPPPLVVRSPTPAGMAPTRRSCGLSSIRRRAATSGSLEGKARFAARHSTYLQCA